MLEILVKIVQGKFGLAAAEVAGDDWRVVPRDQAERAVPRGNGRLPDHLQVQRCGGAEVVVIGERAARSDEVRERDIHAVCKTLGVRVVCGPADPEGTEMLATLHPHIADQLVEISKPGVVSCENHQPVFLMVPPLYHDEERRFLSGGPARRLKAFRAVFKGLPFCHGSPAEQAGTG